MQFHLIKCCLCAPKSTFQGLLSKGSVIPTVLFVISLFPAFHQFQNSAQHVTDMCDRGSVESAASIVFNDGVERYFISSGLNYWLLNLTSDKPDVDSALKIPYNFIPDAAILKDTRDCSGSFSLLLIQMKHNPDSNEAEWFTLEMKIGNWNDNVSGPVFWNQINKIAHCDLLAGVCTTTDNYFATMSFDFKTKLDSAFGTIGATAYFVQGMKMFKVIYRSQCISNPYKEVITYPGVDINKPTTAALFTSIENNGTLVLFDHDIQLQLPQTSLDDISIDSQADNWQDNAYYFFKQCPSLNSAFNFLLLDIFSGSKRHQQSKQIVVAVSVVLLVCLALVTILVIFLKHHQKPSTTKPKDKDTNSETNDEQLIDKAKSVQIKPQTQNGDQQKTLLQTSC